KAPPPAPEMAQPVDLSSIQPVLQRKKVEELTQLKKEFENLGEGTSQRNNIEGHFSRDSSALKAVMSALDKKQGNRILVGIERLLARAQFPNLMKVIGAKSQTDRQEIAKAIQAYYERGEAVYPVPLRNQGIEMNSPAGREIVGKAQDEESRKNLLKILQK
ncbi:hypothetical protein HYT95_02245, partial [Candidatus Peregrinibacteria bacterium]|nr:hypothetical protein [Candidatus Peregrinibacteria bacterium]